MEWFKKLSTVEKTILIVIVLGVLAFGVWELTKQIEKRKKKAQHKK